MQERVLETHPRILGIDYGTKRIGLAITDPLGLTVQPLMTIERRRSPREDIRSIARLARRNEVAEFVVGLPLHLSGDESPRAEKTRVFAEELATFSGLPVHLHDERLTSREAHQMLYEAGRPREEHKAVIDQLAAVLILESYLTGAMKRE